MLLQRGIDHRLVLAAALLQSLVAKLLQDLGIQAQAHPRLPRGWTGRVRHVWLGDACDHLLSVVPTSYTSVSMTCKLLFLLMKESY